ncbi:MULTISPECIES: TnpV protein [Coprococcus]|uniref:TnpV protein n=1 Tax=Coprococcus TaxID=33042 RepID=UPI001FA8EDB7|nr:MULTISPECIES: TnpV protein [Coprococcus]
MFRCCWEFYSNSTRQRFCNTDCTKAHQQAEAMFSRLVKQLSEKEGITEALKEENQMLWVQRMNNIRSAAMEIVSSVLIYC